MSGSGSKSGKSKFGNTTGGRGGAGTRGMHVRVKKKAGTIKETSRRWLERHLNDPY
ncbi:23S rRNA methyltransferase, partial [Ochrobactrum sp. MR31]|nr:23S rRNA methyltransferase [Ochrobactrum sp. MR31]